MTDPGIVFPMIAVVLLTIIWGTTGLWIKSDYAEARQTAARSTAHLAQTYEAQVLRGLREIDRTLKVIKYAYENGNGTAVLSDLRDRELLLPDLLFTVDIADIVGNIPASTGGPAVANVFDQAYFQAARHLETLAISIPQHQPDSGEWTLHFSRRLNSPDGRFAGIAIVSVSPDYFVSGYEQRSLGENGVLGLLGTDGIFRVRRTGDSITYDDTVDYETVMAPDQGFKGHAEVTLNDWDNVQRYTVARELYAFPLAVLVGISESEQLVAAEQSRNAHLLKATAASILGILVIMSLGILSRKLQLSRMRALEEQIEHAKEVEYLAFHDGLTGLPNRSLFSKYLQKFVSNASRYDRQLPVLFLDLDRFKLINDTLGHDAGDELLKQVASRLQSSLRDSDIAARLGGDEFVVLLPELNDQEHLAAVATKILDSVRRPFTLAGKEYRITVSIGISSYPQHGEDEQTLMKNADIAMYNAREEGKNTFKHYSEALNANSLEHLAIESDLRGALERREFTLFYQARQNISSSITGIEALLRWDHPELGLIAPKQFLPFAEELGLSVQIGKWVLESACRQCVAWKKQGLVFASMAVNLSAREFYDEVLMESITGVIHETGMDPRLLEIEVAESMLMQDLENALLILDRLREIGVRVAVDNFGAGYSTLSTLKQFKLDTIKVDGTVIRDITSNAEVQDMVVAIIGMAKVLGFTVVAEGVETREQAELLAHRSCDELQGYYFSKPSPASSMSALLFAQKNG